MVCRIGGAKSKETCFEANLVFLRCSCLGGKRHCLAKFTLYVHICHVCDGLCTSWRAKAMLRYRFKKLDRKPRPRSQSYIGASNVRGDLIIYLQCFILIALNLLIPGTFIDIFCMVAFATLTHNIAPHNFGVWLYVSTGTPPSAPQLPLH